VKGETMSTDVEVRQAENVAAMCEFMRSLAQMLVDDPAAVVVVPVVGADFTTLQVQVCAGDVGKLVGKEGRTARSMRTILSAASTKLGHRFALDIVHGVESAEIGNSGAVHGLLGV
jgi:predicted RNA-binding protein YlqC (UPF0109 family)